MASSRSSFLAAVLSIIPGLGQLYKGHIIVAIIWFVFISGLYSLSAVIWPMYIVGIGFHLLCILHAFFMKD